MDLGTSDYVAGISKPSKLELLHPGTGEKMSKTGGNDLYVDVLGIDSDVVSEAKRQAQRDLMKSKPGEETIGTFEVKVALAASVGFYGGTGSVSTLDEFKLFLQNHPDGKFYARQIVKKSESVGDFFEKPRDS